MNENNNHFVRRLVSFLLSLVMLANTFYYCIPVSGAKESTEPIIIDIPEDTIHPEEKEIVFEDESKVVEEVDREPVVDEEVVEVVEEPQPTPEPEQPATTNAYTNCLTKRGGVYHNPYTGLKETWYSQRVLPGGGLRIPGRHVNEEGFICDADGYICLASSTYAKGTVVETSRGMGKVYDSGCAPGTIDLYTDW